MSVLPTSEYIAGPDQPYYGYGGSNQTTRNSPEAVNLAPGMAEPGYQPDLYVPDDSENVDDLKQQVIVIQGDIVNLNQEVVVVQGDIIDINNQIAAMAATIIPVSFTAFSNSSNANGASVTNNAITLMSASATAPGAVNLTTQSFAGSKSFVSPVSAPALLLPTTTGSNVGAIQVNGATFIHRYGSDQNVFIGTLSGNFSNTVSASTCVGYNTGHAGTGFVSCSFYGYGSGEKCTTGHRNCAFGSGSGNLITTGTDNCIFGVNAFAGTTSSNCIVIGSSSGSNITTQNYIIDIGGNTNFPSPSSGDIRIGHIVSSRCFMAGIYGVTVSSTPLMVVMDSNGQFGTQSVDNLLNTSFTPTLDNGTITASTVRSVSGTVVPFTLTRIGNAVTMSMASFMIQSQSAAATTINMTGLSSIPVLYRPKYNQSLPVVMLNNSSFLAGFLYVTSGGQVSLQSNAAFLTLPSGLPYDVTVSWNIMA